MTTLETSTNGHAAAGVSSPQELTPTWVRKIERRLTQVAATS